MYNKHAPEEMTVFIVGFQIGCNERISVTLYDTMVW